MDQLSIDLPDDLAAFVSEQAGGELSSPQVHEYVLALITEEMERRARLRTEIRKGLEGRDSQLTVEQIWERAAERAKSRAA